MKRYGIGLQVMLLLMAIVFSRPVMLAAEDRGRVAVLPFKVHALKPLDHLERGLQEMLTLRIGNRGFQMTGVETINKHPLAFLPQFEKKALLKLGRDLKSDWIVFGSVTQIGKRISLDLKVVDVSEKREPFFIFMVAEDIDALADITERIAVSLDHQIAGVVQVDSVQVKGNLRVEKEAILAVVRTKKGERFDSDRLDKDLRDIYKMGFFEDVTTVTEDGPKGKIVVFKVVEKPSVGKIVFKGNKKMDDDDLRKELGINRYSILDQNEIKQSVNRLKEYYHKKAYFDVEIKERIEPLPNNEVLLEYEITENDKVFIRNIQFEGNTKFDDDDLKDIMLTSEKGFLSWITDSGYLDKKKLAFDVHKITSFYHNHGYIKARVGEPRVSHEKGKGLAITMEVYEGPQYGVNTVAVEALEGELIRPLEEIMEKVQINKEKIFNREIVRRDMLALRNLYADEGYAYAEVSPGIREDNEAHLVDITYRISKGLKVVFERISISGNIITRDKVIRRELKVVEKEYYSGKGLKKSSENLKRLDFFEDVELKTSKGSGEDLMVLDVNIKEKPTGSFSFGTGYSSADDIFGMVQITQNNLFGYGQKLQASIRIGGSSGEYDISFTEPWLLDREVSGRFRAFNWEREFRDYTKDSFGGDITIGWPIRRFDEFTSAWARYRYDEAEISDVSTVASFLVRQMEGKSVSSAMLLGIRRDSTDRQWNARKGSINSFSVEYAGGIFGGDNYFTQFDLRTAWFIPFFWDSAFMVQGQFGYINERSGGDLPVYEKYFLGGMNTIRGFEYAEVSPYDPVTLDKVGGETMMVYNLEYRFPVLKSYGIVGVVFFDAGKVYTSARGIVERDMATSVGGGVRWKSPVGPLRLEYGYNLDRQLDEPAGKFEFSMGSSF